MLLAWGLTTNPQSVKIYRADSTGLPVYNGFTFKFSLEQDIGHNNNVELLLDDTANVLCGTLVHTLPPKEGLIASTMCTCSNTATKKVVCSAGKLSKNVEYNIKIKVGWDYDSTPDDIATTFGILKVYPYDDLVEAYSSTSIVVY